MLGLSTVDLYRGSGVCHDRERRAATIWWYNTHVTDVLPLVHYVTRLAPVPLLTHIDTK